MKRFTDLLAGQVKFLLSQKEAVITFYILLAFVLSNFCRNVVDFQGSDVHAMVYPMRLLVLSMDCLNYKASTLLMFIQIYPLLVVLPAGLSLARDRNLGPDLLLTSRIGSMDYRIIKVLGAGIATFIVFSVPFLLEMLMNMAAFPMKAFGNLSSLSVYDPAYAAGVRNYLFSGLYLRSPLLYSLLGILFFAFLSGVLAAFTASISSLIRIRLLLILFLPVYALLTISSYFGGRGGQAFAWYHYFFLFDDVHKSTFFLSACLVLILVFTVAATLAGGRKDCIR